MATNEALSRLMDERGVSVRDLARATGLSLASVRRLRAKDMSGNLHTWVLVADALGVKVDDVLKEVEDEGDRPCEG